MTVRLPMVVGSWEIQALEDSTFDSYALGSVSARCSLEQTPLQGTR